MPITPLYHWTETNGNIEVVIPLKGNKASQADVFAAENYVKVSFAQYLLELDLIKNIDDHAVKATAKDGNLLLKLKKAEMGLWSTLTVKADRATRHARRSKAVEERREREQKIKEQVKERKVEIERTTLRAQMAMEQAERQKLDDLKAEEKRRAEEEIYRTFSELEAKRVQEEEEREAAASKAAQPKVGGGNPSRKASSSAASSITEDAQQMIKKDENKIQQSICDEVIDDEEVHQESSDEGDEEVNGKEEDEELVIVEEEGEEEEREARYVPGPRNAAAGEAKIKIGFTPRVFPTPMRESKRAEEDDWIARNRPHLHKNKTLTGQLARKDARDISEADPVWLKGKGDDFYRAGDYQAALNAFSASLDVQSDQPKALSNRAACYLRLGRSKECVEDCTKALELAVLPPEQQKDDSQAIYANKALRLRLHVRRGTAHCQILNYEKALEDYRAALYHSPEDLALALDLRRLEILVQCQNLKNDGDQKFGTGDLEGACLAYSKALEMDPTFVACLSNRAACYMAQGNLAAALVDCDDALQCLEEEGGAGGGEGKKIMIGGGSQQQVDLAASLPSLSSIPPPGSEERNMWVLKTVARRGVIRGALGQLEAAREDYRLAIALSPGDEALLRDLGVIEERVCSSASVSSKEGGGGPATTASSLGGGGGEIVIPSAE